MKTEHKEMIDELMAKSFLLTKREKAVVSQLNKVRHLDFKLSDYKLLDLQAMIKKYQTKK